MPSPRPPRAVLFDRDGTLVVDVPYCADPAQVTPVPTARAALTLLRAAGIRIGVVSNQSGIARGLLDRAQVDAVNRRVDALLGPFDVWQVCPHGPDDGCACRKPEPGMVLAAASRLGVAPGDVAVVGDIGADVGAARAAGARSVLVPTPGDDAGGGRGGAGGAPRPARRRAAPARRGGDARGRRVRRGGPVTLP